MLRLVFCCFAIVCLSFSGCAWWRVSQPEPSAWRRVPQPEPLPSVLLPDVVEVDVKIENGRWSITRFTGNPLDNVTVHKFGRDELMNELVLEVSLPQWPSERFLGRVLIANNAEMTMKLIRQLPHN